MKTFSSIGLGRGVVVGLGVLWAGAAGATDGYFCNGFGMKAKGRAGVSLAEWDDAFGGANNPATIALAADQAEIGVAWFNPRRSAARTGPFPPLNGAAESDHDNFFIPEIAYKHGVNSKLALGVSIYGNGGMNTDYPSGQLVLQPGAPGANLLAGPGHLGVNMSQLLIAPTAAWKLAQGHTVGIAPTVAYQRFSAYGLDAFRGLSQDPTAVSNNGVDQSWGVGARVGYLWEITDQVALGASYASTTFCQKFEKYRGLFAGDGGFDIPQSAGVGLGWQALPEVRLGLDYKWIDYGGIDSVGRSSASPAPLGSAGSPGFGWRSISAVKFGVDWNVCQSWTVRTGYSFNESPVRGSDVTFNILAPGVIRHHLTAGITYATGRHEFTLAYMHGFRESVSGPSRLVDLGLAPAGTREEVSMAQDSVGFQYALHF